MIDTADSVFHRPSREWWLVAYVSGNKLSACGWPETIADVTDCLLVTKATPAERLDLLVEMSKSTGNRASYARAALAQQQAEPIGWLCSPDGHFKRNPLYRIEFPPESLAWQVPIYAARQQQAEPVVVQKLEKLSSDDNLGNPSY